MKRCVGEMRRGLAKCQCTIAKGTCSPRIFDSGWCNRAQERSALASESVRCLRRSARREAGLADERDLISPRHEATSGPALMHRPLRSRAAEPALHLTCLHPVRFTFQSDVRLRRKAQGVKGMIVEITRLQLRCFDSLSNLPSGLP